MMTGLLVAAAAMFGADAPVAAEPTYAEKLGWPAGSRVVIFHVDDAGMSHDSNVGTLEAMTKGVATSTSIMYPCPWVSEAVKMFAENPGLDVGVHVTLTSEWGKYRWAPVAGKQTVPSLTDKEGCLYDDVPLVLINATADDVETEIRAQVDRSLSVGIQPTHLDSHMGTVFANFLFCERYMKVGMEMGIPVMAPGGHMAHMGKSMPLMVKLAREMGKKLWDAGLPVLDDLHTGDMAGKGPELKKQQVIDFLRTLQPGVTQYIVHCTRPTETFQHISGSGGMRLAELEALTDPEVAQVIKDEGIILTTWREMKQRRDAVAAK